MFNNLGMVLMRLHEPSAEEDDSKDDGEENKQLFMSTLQKKKNKKNANRNKALEQARDAFGKAIELDNEYIKPLF